MAVSIRLTRGGRKARPYYRIVAAEAGCPRDGRFLEILGHYHPLNDPPSVEIDEGRLRHYVDSGAAVSDTVKSLCKQKGYPVKPVKA